MAVNHRDVAGNVLALVEAWKTHAKIEARLATADDALARKKLRDEAAEQQLVMEQTAIELATGVISDLRRIAEALESLAMTQANKFEREVHRGQ